MVVDEPRLPRLLELRHRRDVKASLISQMFAATARGEMSAEDAVRAAEAQIKPIFERWRQQGKI